MSGPEVLSGDQPTEPAAAEPTADAAQEPVAARERVAAAQEPAPARDREPANGRVPGRTDTRGSGDSGAVRRRAAPLGVAHRGDPAGIGRMSPRARLAQLAGDPEPAPAPAVSAPPPAGADQPVDAPATTALPRPRDGGRPTGAAAEGVGAAEPAALPASEAPTAVIVLDGGGTLPPELSPRPEEDGGPPRRPRGLVRALVVGLAAIVSCALFLVIGLGYGATKYYETQLSRTDLSAGRVEGTRPPAIPHGRETWLLVGSDVRTGADSAEVGGARSDTMMIGYLGSNGSTTLVSVPRDLKVTIPAFTDSAGKHHSARTDKINSAFNLGGPALLLRTLENVTNVRIDHFAEIDFSGFKQMSDVLGGVEVCMVKDPFKEYVAEDGKTSTNLNDPMSGFRGQVGANVLEGDNALAFVRQRHGFVNGDYSRIQRQQAFLAAVFRKVNSGNLLTDPGKLAGFLNAVTGAITVDSGTSLTDLRTLAERLHAMDAGQVHFTTIPLSGAQSAPVYYALYDPAMVRAFVQQIINGDDAAPAAGSPTPSVAPSPTVAPSQIRVTVLNGSPTGGTANKVAAKLRAAGYQVVRVGTNASRQIASTEVLYPQSQAAAASRLLADIPGARLVPNTEAAAGSGGVPTTSPAGSSATATATGGMLTLVVGEDLVSGDTSVIATPTAAARTPGATVPYYTQAPVSAAAGCVK
ncbi:LCP family protein [Frankia sp. AgB1.9]|uniref:LCP family protein n=2 Tax=unclassified Frankia TaxID=2632575 RepID=UPI0019320A8C|nr:LCP family protein [Frankia sp. AgB1.9]MBL7549976.1 LCP family protein [Frankia sp. AgB1.9]